jgi:hypothetical protein
MKKVTMLFLAVMPLIVFSQQAAKVEAQKSNAEKFSERAGFLIKKEYTDLGEVKKCKIQLITFTDMVSGQTSSGIQFSYDYKASYGTDTKLAMLDDDEIEGLMKSIKIIKDKVLTTTPSAYTEVSFKSRTGFAAGCFVNKDKNWDAYLKLEKYDSNSYVFLDKEDLDQIVSLLNHVFMK